MHSLIPCGYTHFHGKQYGRMNIKMLVIIFLSGYICDDITFSFCLCIFSNFLKLDMVWGLWGGRRETLLKIHKVSIYPVSWLKNEKLYKFTRQEYDFFWLKSSSSDLFLFREKRFTKKEKPKAKERKLRKATNNLGSNKTWNTEKQDQNAF